MAVHYEAPSRHRPPFIFIFLLSLSICPIVYPSKISNLKMCADIECKDTISEASAIKSYLNDDPKFLSFGQNDIISIKSKSAGRVPYLWSGEINGNVGYFPMSHVRENQVFIRKPSHLVSTGEVQDEPVRNNLEFESEPREEVDETEIEEDEPSNVKIEEKEEPAHSPPEAERDETEIEEEEEVTPKMPEANQQINTKEESITQSVDEIMNAYHQISQESQISTNEKMAATSENEQIQEIPQNEQQGQISEPDQKFTDENYQSPDIIKDPTPTPQPDVLEQAQQFHNQSPDITRDPVYTSSTHHTHEQAHHTHEQGHHSHDQAHHTHEQAHHTHEQAHHHSQPHYAHSQPHYTHSQPPDIINDPMQTRHSDVLEQAHQTHSGQESSPTRVHDDSASRLIEATPAATTFTSPQSSYTVFDGTTLFDGVTPGSEAPQTATASRYAYEKPTEKVTRAFVETSVHEQRAASPESSKPANINIDPSSSFVAPSSNFNPNSRHGAFVKKTQAMHPDLENVPSRERQREDVSKSRHEDMHGVGITAKSVSPPAEQHSMTGNPGKRENLTVPEIGNFMKFFEVYLKSILDMSPTALQNFLEQEPFGIPPTILLFYTICGIFFSLFFLITCSCFSSTSPKPKIDPVVIIRNLEEKLFITTKEKENLEDDIQAMKDNVNTLQQNVEIQKSSTGSAESDLQRQRSLNEELKEINDSMSQKLAHLQTESEEFRSLHEQNDKWLHIVEEEKVKVTYEYEMICEKHQELTQALSLKETECSRSQNLLETLMEQINQLEPEKEQLLEEAEEWTEKHQELIEKWDRTQAEYNKMQETLDYKENELEQLKECFLQMEGFEEDSEEATTNLDNLAASQSRQDKIQSMLDVSSVKAMLAAAEEEKNAFQRLRQIEVECRLELEDQIEALKRDVETSQTDKAKAIRQNDEAQTKLSVLTTYFKEKEMQFQRELGEQEILKKQNINKLGTAEDNAKCIESELDSYKSQIEDLKQEISRAERDFRNQIASNEKKAHENWLATRTAERELKESRMECTMLRQKLTELECRLSTLIRQMLTRGSGHLEMGNGPPLLPPFPGDHPGGRKDLMPPLRDDLSNLPPMKSPSPNFRPPRPSPPNFRPPPPMKNRGPPPPLLDGGHAFPPPPPWQRPPPGQGPRMPFGNRPPPPPLSSKGNPRGPPFGHPPPMLRSLPDFSSLPDKHPPSKQHSQV